MTGRKIAQSCYGVNKTDAKKVRELADTMLATGWVGCPILTIGDELLTGSHRLAALKLILSEDWDAEVLDQDVSEDVADIVDANMRAYEDEHGWLPDLDYSDIGRWLKGSWVEQYKAEIIEW